MVDGTSVIFSVAFMFGAVFGRDILAEVVAFARIVRARIEAAVERAADAAPRDSFPGLSHTTEVPRELE